MGVGWSGIHRSVGVLDAVTREAGHVDDERGPAVVTSPQRQHADAHGLHRAVGVLVVGAESLPRQIDAVVVDRDRQPRLPPELEARRREGEDEITESLSGAAHRDLHRLGDRAAGDPEGRAPALAVHTHRRQPTRLGGDGRCLRHDAKALARRPGAVRRERENGRTGVGCGGGGGGVIAAAGGQHDRREEGEPDERPGPRRLVTMSHGNVSLDGVPRIWSESLHSPHRKGHTIQGAPPMEPA